MEIFMVWVESRVNGWWTSAGAAEGFGGQGGRRAGRCPTQRRRLHESSPDFGLESASACTFVLSGAFTRSLLTARATGTQPGPMALLVLRHLPTSSAHGRAVGPRPRCLRSST